MKDILDEFENYMANLSFTGSELYTPVKYILSSMGKKVRPILLISAYQMFRNDYSACFPAAAAVEIFHNFTLVHDDIMDKAPLRRGKPTVHIEFGEDAGILSGDAMLILSYQFLAEAIRGNSQGLRLIDWMNQTALQVCEGQQLDMDFEKQSEISMSEYMEMIRLKTAALLSFALKVGSFLGKTSSENILGFEELGINLGLGFQIMDDWLDLYGTNKSGKRSGGDILQGKKTFLYCRLLEVINPNDREVFINEYSNISEPSFAKVERIKKWYDQYEVGQYAKSVILSYHHKAYDFINNLDVEEDKKSWLRELVNSIQVRTY